MEIRKQKTLEDFPKFTVTALRRFTTSAAGYTSFEHEGTKGGDSYVCARNVMSDMWYGTTSPSWTSFNIVRIVGANSDYTF